MRLEPLALLNGAVAVIAVAVMFMGDIFLGPTSWLVWVGRGMCGLSGLLSLTILYRIWRNERKNQA